MATYHVGKETAPGMSPAISAASVAGSEVVPSTFLMMAPSLTWNMASRFLAQLTCVSASTSVEASVSAKTAAMMLKMAWPPTTEATRGLTRSALPMTPGRSAPVSLSPPSEVVGGKGGHAGAARVSADNGRAVCRLSNLSRRRLIDEFSYNSACLKFPAGKVLGRIHGAELPDVVGHQTGIQRVHQEHTIGDSGSVTVQKAPEVCWAQAEKELPTPMALAR